MTSLQPDGVKLIDLENRTVEESSRQILRHLFERPAQSYSDQGATYRNQTQSIHRVVSRRLEAMEAGNSNALGPSAAVDETLGRLVEIITGDYGTSVNGSVTSQDAYHFAVTAAVLHAIQDDLVLS